MNTHLLDLDAFNQTFAAPMQDVTATSKPVVDLWSYIDAIPLPDLAGATLADVACVYRSSSQLFEHVLIATTDKNVFLVAVIALAESRIYGHYLLSLAELYSLSDGSA